MKTLAALRWAATMLSLTKDKNHDQTRKLTPKQAAFVEEFACDLNATQAAISAGYSAKTAKERATRTTCQISIAAEIAEARAQRSERNGITAEKVLPNWPASRSLTSQGAQSGRHDEAARRTRRRHSGGNRRARTVGDSRREGAPIGVLKKIKIADKLVALDKLARNLGLLQDKIN